MYFHSFKYINTKNTILYYTNTKKYYTNTKKLLPESTFLHVFPAEIITRSYEGRTRPFSSAH